jgi:hypothetical protein
MYYLHKANSISCVHGLKRKIDRERVLYGIYGRETEEREREKTGRKRLTQEIIGKVGTYPKS